MVFSLAFYIKKICQCLFKCGIDVFFIFFVFVSAEIWANSQSRLLNHAFPQEYPDTI